MLYWSDNGPTPRIEASWLDGQQRRVLVENALGWPTGLSIDYTNNDRIYWSDAKESRIESMLPDGQGRRTSVYIGRDLIDLAIWLVQSEFLMGLFQNSRFISLTGDRIKPAVTITQLIIFKNSYLVPLSWLRCEKPFQCGCIWGPCLLEHTGERRSVQTGQIWQRCQNQTSDSRTLAHPDQCLPATEIQLYSQWVTPVNLKTSIWLQSIFKLHFLRI